MPMVKIVDVSESTTIDRGPFDADQLCGLETSSERESVTKDYGDKGSFKVTKNYKQEKFDKYAKGN